MLTVSACGEGNNTSVMNAEFRSLSGCLAGLEKSSGYSLKINIDKPDKVVGSLANGKTFACEREVSGTKGVYYKGWYVVDR